MRFLSQDEAHRSSIVSVARYAGLPLPDRPRLAPWIVAVDLSDGRLQLRSFESAHTLTHPLLVSVFHFASPLLDGCHTLDEITTALTPEVLPTTTEFLLKLLQGKGLLLRGAEPDAPERVEWTPQLDFLSRFVPDASSAQRALAAARVAVSGGGALARAVSGTLESTGIGTCANAASAELIVACADSPAFGFFDRVNRDCLATGTRWLRVVVCGGSAELGPTIVPYQTACYTCFDLRRRTHETEIEGYLGYRRRIADEADRAGGGGTMAFFDVVAGHATLEVMRLLTGFAPPATIGRYHALSALSPAANSHDVLKVPRCPACDTRRSVPEAWDRGFALIGIEP
jgi:bacteriocin biosynthesis cyclodehydratase domain-containing protein